MTSLEKFNKLIEFEVNNIKAKITTINGDVYYCAPQCPAEDEDDWAYSFFTPDYPTHYFIMECNFIVKMEEISDEEWIQHLKQSKNDNLSENR